MQCFGSEKSKLFPRNSKRIVHSRTNSTLQSTYKCNMRIATFLFNIQFPDHLLRNESWFNFRVNVLTLDQFMFSSVALCLLEFLLQICLKAVSNCWNPAGRFSFFIPRAFGFEKEWSCEWKGFRSASNFKTDSESREMTIPCGALCPSKLKNQSTWYAPFILVGTRTLPVNPINP